jgi:hypothetical protein
MRNILHAKFGDQLAKQSRTSDKVPRISPSPQLPSKPVEELEAALTKARDALACKQRTNPDGHLQSPDREASIETHRRSP